MCYVVDGEVVSGTQNQRPAFLFDNEMADSVSKENNTMEKTQKTKQRKIYKSPKLRIYGSILDATLDTGQWRNRDW